MALYPTPGVYNKEEDRAVGTQNAGTSSGAMVGRFSKGPVNREVPIDQYTTFTDTFGTPLFSATDTPVFGYGHYMAEEFLGESKTLHVVRVCDSSDKFPNVRFLAGFDNTSTWTSASDVSYSGVNADQTPSLPDTDTRIGVLDAALGATDKLLIGALCPGVEGMNLGVTIESFNTSADWLASYDNYPTNSAVAAVITSAINLSAVSVATFSAALQALGAQYNLETILPVATKTIKINVYQKGTNESWADINAKLAAGTITLSDLTPIETYEGTLGFQKDASNHQMRLSDLINGVSKNIYVVANANASLAYEILPKTTEIFPLSGGAINYADGTGDNDATAVLEAWDFFADPEYVDVNIFMNWDWNASVKQKVANLAATRMKSIATGQTGIKTDTTVAAVKSKELYGYKDPSFMSLFAGWDLRKDSVNDRNVYVPKAIFAPSKMAYVDRTGNTWDAIAGDPNGILPTLGQYKTFNFTEIGQLGLAGINTSRWLKGVGHTLWKQNTAQLKNSPRKLISVRRMLNYLEASMELTLMQFLFNIVNDEKTRTRISSLLNNGINKEITAGAKPGASKANAQCDSINNPASVIDADPPQLVIWEFVTPTKPVEVILIKTIIEPSGVSFIEE